jgi:hypothetical protein
MSETQRLTDIETLARMAARLAGRDPDEQVNIRLAGVSVFEGVVWRYPDFLGRAKEAYAALARSVGPTV